MTKSLIAALLTGALVLPCFGQSEKGASSGNAPELAVTYYRLNFSVREVEGDRMINNRDYSMVLSGNRGNGRWPHSEIRAGARVPVGTQEINVGANIDCADAQESAGEFRMNLSADISSIIDNGIKAAERPVTRYNIWHSDVKLPLRQQTLLFSSDDPSSKRKMQLYLTVTPIR